MSLVIRNLQRKVPIDIRSFRKEAERAVSLLGLDKYEVSIILVNDTRCRQLNKQFRGKDRPTDVLSFPLYDSLQEAKKAKSLGEVLLGDIVINVHMCQRIADKEKVPLRRILREMAIHGLLHLIGYDHERSPSEARKMKKKQKELIDAIEKMD